jgi:hypothetical protein
MKRLQFRGFLDFCGGSIFGRGVALISWKAPICRGKRFGTRFGTFLLRARSRLGERGLLSPPDETLRM